MYYHQIDFLTQTRFFAVSFFAGIVDGVLALILCSNAIAAKIRVFTDILFSLFSVLLIVCCNIIFQDAALRIYEFIAFVAGVLLVVFLFKKKSDRALSSAVRFVNVHVLEPLCLICKRCVKKTKNILKKSREVVYNFYSKSKEKCFTHAKRKKQKNKEKKATETNA